MLLFFENFESLQKACMILLPQKLKITTKLHVFLTHLSTHYRSVKP